MVGRPAPRNDVRRELRHSWRFERIGLVAFMAPCWATLVGTWIVVEGKVGEEAPTTKGPTVPVAYKRRWHISGNIGTTALRETWKRVSAEMKTP